MAQKDNDKVVKILTEDGSKKVSLRGFSFKQELILTGLSQIGPIIGGGLALAAAIVDLRASKVQVQKDVDKIVKAV